MTQSTGKSEILAQHKPVGWNEIRPYTYQDIQRIKRTMKEELELAKFYGNLAYGDQQIIRLLRTIEERNFT